MILQALTPDCVFDTIYEITPAFLCKHAIRGVLIDIDGTAASHRAALPEKQLYHYIASLQQAGIRAVFLSNNHAARVKKFSEAIGIPSISRAVKPLPFGFWKGAAVLQLPMKEIAVIGDQIFTDIIGGNCLGALTCQVRSIDCGEFWITVRCRLERVFIERGRRKMQEDEKNVH